MSFTTPLFLFLFLPLMLLVYQFTPKRLRNLYILAASLLFYAWTQWTFLVVIGFTILGNWALASSFRHKNIRTYLFSIGIVFNVGLLVLYKYFLGSFPLGFSFFTFHSLSYLIDTYQGTGGTGSLLTTGVYLLFFPHVSAGPLTQYRNFALQLTNHPTSSELTNQGIESFVTGLAEKMLLANTFAAIADRIFAITPGSLSQTAAWLGLAMYTLQIYFDFAGYSNMAIGLGQLLGFSLPQNFNLPYIASSVSDFWSRWHISLTSWLRQYIYFPLGGSRKGRIRTYLNILIVFVVSGLWHGAGWQFLVWGVWYACFMILEKWVADQKIRIPWILKIFGHVYTLFVVMIGWVFFRTNNLSAATKYLQVLFDFTTHNLGQIYWLSYLTPYTVVATGVGVIAAFGGLRLLTRLPGWIRFLGLSGLLILSLLAVAGTTYNSFIYFHF